MRHKRGLLLLACARPASAAASGDSSAGWQQRQQRQAGTMAQVQQEPRGGAHLRFDVGMAKLRGAGGAKALVGWRVLDAAAGGALIGEVVEVLPAARVGSGSGRGAGSGPGGSSAPLLRARAERTLEPYEFTGAEEHCVPLTPEFVVSLQPGARALSVRLPKGFLSLGRRSLYLGFLAQQLPALSQPVRTVEVGRRETRIMPTRKQLTEAGRRDLVDLVLECGGFCEVAVELGMRARRRPAGYWENLGHLDSELRAFVAGQWVELTAPDTGKPYYYNLVSDRIANTLPSGATPGDVRSKASREDARDRVMPSRATLLSVGRYDLHHGITGQGGYLEVGAQLRRRPPRYCREAMIGCVEELLAGLDELTEEMRGAEVAVAAAWVTKAGEAAAAAAVAADAAADADAFVEELRGAAAAAAAASSAEMRGAETAAAARAAAASSAEMPGAEVAAAAAADEDQAAETAGAAASSEELRRAVAAAARAAAAGETDEAAVAAAVAAEELRGAVAAAAAARAAAADETDEAAVAAAAAAASEELRGAVAAAAAARAAAADETDEAAVAAAAAAASEELRRAVAAAAAARAAANEARAEAASTAAWAAAAAAAKARGEKEGGGGDAGAADGGGEVGSRGATDGGGEGRRRGLLPTERQLRSNDRSDLIYAMHRFGGMRKAHTHTHTQVAQLAGLGTHRRPRHYWRNLDNVVREVREFMAAQQQQEQQQRQQQEMEEQQQQQQEKQQQPAAAAAPASPSPPPSPGPRHLPTRTQLVAAGRHDLLSALQMHGHAVVCAAVGARPQARGVAARALTAAVVEAALAGGPLRPAQVYEALRAAASAGGGGAGVSLVRVQAYLGRRAREGRLARLGHGLYALLPEDGAAPAAGAVEAAAEAGRTG
ncbi:hypothetical protein FOA52_004944 [Chlamydomonas sp. UWO 241]|nr:hypothetical protein FOA52_004944 [Chlamydomonas sp. UWO 241]